MNPRLWLAAFIVPLGLIIAAVPQNKTHPYKLSATELLGEVNTRTQFITPETVADMIVKKDPTLQLIDVRSQDEFEKFSLPGAINIPLTDLLADQNAALFDQDVKMNVFYANSTVSANEAWMITRQLGYSNIFVLEGGLNYWFDAILNPKQPSSASSDEEFAKYDFRRSAGQALGNGVVSTQAAGGNTPASPKPAIQSMPKKKKAAGGC
jgi:sulfur-carrier protein adenylyltransferase/sulfurtransferase